MSLSLKTLLGVSSQLVQMLCMCPHVSALHQANGLQGGVELSALPSWIFCESQPKLLMSWVVPVWKTPSAAPGSQVGVLVHGCSAGTLKEMTALTVTDITCTHCS